MDISGRISQANGRLKSANVGVKIEQHGDRLYLRVTLPPKPGAGKDAPFQQRISLGIQASPIGLKEAEQEARKVGALLACKEFSWEPYLPKSARAETIGDWVGKFSARFRQTVSEVTWTTDYQRVFDRLPENKPLSIEVLTQAIEATDPNSRQRRRFSQTLGKLAGFAGLDADFKHLQGKYSASEVEPRDLPDDMTLAKGWYQVRDPGWRWVYGVLLTYGLRNHEAFYLDTQALEAGTTMMITVVEGKTGRRLVWPCFPEWVDEFGLRDKRLPSVTGQKHSDYGLRVAKFFGREFPYTALDVRHCWAVRTLECNWPIEVAAAQMGHSVAVHSKTYHHWIKEDTYQRIFDSFMNRSDRPLPPSL